MFFGIVGSAIGFIAFNYFNHSYHNPTTNINNSGGSFADATTPTSVLFGGTLEYGKALGSISFEEMFGEYLPDGSEYGLEDFKRRFGEFQDNIKQSLHLSGDGTSQARESYDLVSGEVGHKKKAEYNASGNKNIVKHPVFMAPGFISSKLEVWDAGDAAIQDDDDDKECGGGQYDQMDVFRTQIWGSMKSLKAFVKNAVCWKRFLMLNPKTGLDPSSGIKVRPAVGFDASDTYAAGQFWIWDKVIKNLAQVGYTSSDMTLWSYDWRVEFSILEARDGSFTKLKKAIEASVETNPTQAKAVVMGHSMGGCYLLYFLIWVGKPKEEGGGGGGPDWVENYIDSYIDLAGPLLGLPKAAAAILSGELNYATQWGPWGGLVESLFGRKHRHELWNSWGSLWGMTPKGGDKIWGVAADVECPKGKTHVGTKCIDDEDAILTPSVPFLTFTGNEEGGPPSYENNPLLREYASKESWSYSDLESFLKQWKSDQINHKLTYNEALPPFNDPTKHPLPTAPSLKVYCLYGVGMYNDRMYYYERQEESSHDMPFVMDDSVEDDESEHIFNSMKNVDGDNSVPLLSLGYPCVELWGGRGKDKFNPGGASVVTKEYPHGGSFQRDDPMRQGPYSSEHCDFLGNHEVLEDIIDIATGHDVTPRIVSNIEGIATKIHEHPWNSQEFQAMTQGSAAEEAASGNNGEL